ncbi:Rad1-domain-containing protein [Rhizopogon vinicolor AM-OR11-026]|uniref:Rad1-domain-containing protein n=1 Tax=Rhizopogon vinicolor AM-OR11-026 TaxID=1314800 RepID=A0A1B7NFW0_9AGAM|nr:Rad1-domain-containing protein [Rhizopogon vinicolor AM-OR11-026]
MSQQSQSDNVKPLLTASVHDVRYFTALLRGIAFSNRASVTLRADGGITVTVEEARTLLATSYIYPDHFDEWSYNVDDIQAAPSQLSAPDVDRESITLEIPLNTLIECLNIFGTANISSSSTGSKHKKWRRADGGSDDERGDEGQPPNVNRLDQYFGSNEKRTSMRLSYAGPGHPLTLLLAEDSTGPTTTCEISTFDPEPNIELPFDADQTVLKIIFKSSFWLRDALSELDPSCDKITFICNPVEDVQRAQIGIPAKPLFRIQATGAFGSTEMDYPNDREVLETFECSRSVHVSYRFAHISRTLRALQNSTKTSLRIEEEGLLSLQFLVPVPKPRGGMSDSFIEFRCLALDDAVAQ